MAARRLILIDGFSLMFRAFYGTGFMSTSDGRPTNALFGFTGMLLSLLTEHKPDALVVCLDPPGKTFRHAEYAEYKGTRRETPNELNQQLEFVRELVRAFHLPVMEMPGYEADDVVGTLSYLGETNGYDTIIVTGDLDNLQLVDHAVTVMTTRRGVSDVVMYDPEAVRERYGFGPEAIPDYKALVGDTSDNIPGVPGIGEKSASALLQQFATIEDLLERMDEVPEKFRKKIVGNEEQMRKSKWLATIIRDVPLEYDFAPYALTAEQINEAVAMMQSLEFRQFSRKVPQVLAAYAQASDTPVVVAAVEREAIEPTETARPRDLADLQKFVGDAPWALMPPRAAAQPGMFDEEDAGEGTVAVGTRLAYAPWSVVRELLAQDPSRATGHDVKPVFHGLDTWTAPGFDTMLAAYVLQSGRTNYELDDLLAGYLDGVRPPNPDHRVLYLHPLREVMAARLEAEKQTSVYYEIEGPLVPILADMEDWGIRLDPDYLREYSARLGEEVVEIQRRAWEIAGEEFNLGSPKQIGEVLFERMQLPGGKPTKTGWATGVEVLADLAIEHPIAAEILHYRELTKLRGTYADALPRLVADDQRLHTKFNQTVAATGRLSSNEPNLQNIPIRTELGRQIRRAFIPADGFELASFDYSQIELRILAHLCEDEALTQAFRDHVDVHSVTAGLMFGMETEAVSKEQRRLAKMLNYAVLYGVTEYGLAQQLGTGFGVSEAKALIKQYNERFPRVKAFTEIVVEDARSRGFTVTMTGRRRYFSDIHAGNRTARQYAERQAMNAPIQGTAADMIKLAMLRMPKLLEGTGIRMLLQVHDELVFEVPQGQHAPLEPIREAMEQALPLNVPVEVDAKIGPNWLDMTPIARPN